MKQKRIFIINQADESQNYGVGKYIYEIIKEIKNRKESYQLVSVVLGCSDKTRIEREIEENITYLEIPKPFFYKNELIGLSEQYSKGVFFILNDLFEFNKSDTFHFTSNMQHFLIKYLKKYTKTKIIYSIHISLWKVFYKNNKELFWSDWKNTNNSMEKRNIKAEIENCQFSDTIICLTDTMVKDVVEIYKIPENKIRKIANGISESRNKINEKHLGRLKSELQLKKECFVLLYIGRLNAQKGVSYLIDSFKIIIQKGFKNIKLIIVGDGLGKQDLVSMCNSIRNHVVFTGYISPKLVDHYYQIADAMVLPSLNEQSSYTMLEAMSRKVPMIVTDISAFNVLEDKKTCLKTILKNRNIINQQLLINNINLLIENKKVRKEISKNAYKLFKTKFTSEMMFEKTYSD